MLYNGFVFNPYATFENNPLEFSQVIGTLNKMNNKKNPQNESEDFCKLKYKFLKTRIDYFLIILLEIIPSAERTVKIYTPVERLLAVTDVVLPSNTPEEISAPERL